MNSVASYRHALALRPDDPALHSDLIFALNFDPAATPADQQAERARWNERHAKRYAAAIKPHPNDRDPDRRLRIGYVSSHFRHQAGTYAFGGVLTHHDRDAFEVICYSDTRQEDDLTPQLRGCAAKWHRTADLSDDQLAELIRSDGIDILVELVGHMQGSRLLACARKPAPIQLNAWGEPTGSASRRRLSACRSRAGAAGRRAQTSLTGSPTSPAPSLTGSPTRCRSPRRCPRCHAAT